MKNALIFTGFLLAAQSAHAVLSTSRLESLAHSPSWYALLYYREGLTGIESESDDPTFFLSKNGKQDPVGELSAHLEAFSLSTPEGDQHPQCKFPARYHWLKQQRVFSKRVKDQACPAFENFRNDLGAAGVTMIYPVPNMDSVSTLFGHSFLRLDRDKRPQADHDDDFTLNFAAHIKKSDDQADVVVKGLSGAFQGVFTVMPYHKKLREYLRMEARDIWEYQLNLTQAETDQLVRHAWEVRRAHFDYKFLSENCSYRMLNFLDVARGGMNLRDEYSMYVIPMDAVQTVIDAELVEQVSYKPAIKTQVSQALVAFSDEDVAWLKQSIAENQLALDDLPKTDEKQRQQLVGTALLYGRTLAAEGTWNASDLERYEDEAPTQAESPEFLAPAPRTLGDAGHHSGRVQISAGQRDGLDIVSFALRPAYHDAFDSPTGEPLGMDITVLEVSGRKIETQDAELTSLTFISATSLKPRDALFKPWSWQLATGITGRRLLEDETAVDPDMTIENQALSEEERFQQQLENSDWSNPFYARAAIGPAWGSANTAYYHLFGAELQAADALAKGYDSLWVWNQGILTRHDQWQATLELALLDSTATAETPMGRLRGSATRAIDSTLAVFMQGVREKDVLGYQSEWRLGISIYY